MDSGKPQNGHYQRYDPPNVVPMSRRPAPVTAFLGSLRSAGAPETLIEKTRVVLGSIGVTDATIDDLRKSVGVGTRKSVDWSRDNPKKAAGGLAAIVIAFGLLLVLLERRR